MTVFDVQYQKEFEVVRVKNCVSKLFWYDENGYKVSLPEKVTAQSSGAEIKAQVESEFNEEKYLQFATELKIEWQQFSSEFEKVKGEATIAFSDKYTVLLTKYGTGGSYNATSDQIIVKIEGRTVSSVLGTLVHEMVHIAIQKFIEKYEVTHWKKERLVDLILEHYFPSLRSMQIITEDVSEVDKAFNQFFPDIEKITKVVSSEKL
jgi:hypothetical protein